MEQVTGFMQAYTLKGQHASDRALTRYSSDLCKMVENNEISTGPGRYALGVPNAYGNAVFVPDATVRMQKWGAAHDMSSTKTDVESDLLNLGRPTTRTVCGQYNPHTAPSRTLTAMPEEEFPQTHGRLVDPPCTLRDSGWNRWAWLCQNPQENVMIPFEHGVDSRQATKDSIYSELQAPIANSALVRDRQMMCGSLYVEQAMPVARPPGAKDAKNFNDVIPGTSQRFSVPPPIAYEKVHHGYTHQGVSVPNAPPRGPINEAERERAETGVLRAPPPFTTLRG